MPENSPGKFSKSFEMYLSAGSIIDAQRTSQRGKNMSYPLAFVS